MARTLVNLLESPALYSRYGACQALTAVRGRGAPAIEPLRKALSDPDLWLRIKAAEALAAIGAPAMPVVPQLLKLLAQVDPQSDPRGMQQRYLSFALFDGGGMLSRSIEGVDREALYEAVRAGRKNQDGRAPGRSGRGLRHLLVVGAYGHSRLREFVFGGATREILEHMTVPVLMSH